MNYRVVTEENNYPLNGGISTLIGIYPDKDSAEFIKNIVSTKFNIQGELKIDEVDDKLFPATSSKVATYLNIKFRDNR